MTRLPSKAGNACFGCGQDNPLGLKLDFDGEVTTNRVRAEFTPPAFMTGGANMMHGGFISLLLDEASSKVLSLLCKKGVTRQLDVSFDKPVPLETPLRIEATLDKIDGRKHWINACLKNHTGETLAQSNALFLVFRTK